MNDIVPKLTTLKRIPTEMNDKGWSESVNRKTDNKLTKRKGIKEQTTIYKILHRKLKIEQHEPH
jgi:hypothetical protein